MPKGKKKKSGKQIFASIVSVVIIVVTAILTVAVLLIGAGGTGDFSANEAQNTKPNVGETINLATLLAAYTYDDENNDYQPSDYDFSALIAAAGDIDLYAYIAENATDNQLIHICYALYTTANANYKAINACAYEVNSMTEMMVSGISIPVQGYRYCLKKGTEYYMTEYSIPPEGNFMGQIAGAAAADGSHFARRQYCNDPENFFMLEQKSLKPTMTVVDGKNVYDVDWTNLAVDGKQNEALVYCSEQEGDFAYTDIIINPRTIKKAELEYDAEAEVYTMKLELYADYYLTTSKTLENLKSSSGQKDAHYTSINETIKLWNNGYFKYFLSVDEWAGGVMSSTINFETNFFYEGDYMDFANYQYYAETKAEMEKD